MRSTMPNNLTTPCPGEPLAEPADALSRVLLDARAAIVHAATRRLRERAEFLSEPDVPAERVARCLDAMQQAAQTGDPRRLLDAALHEGRHDRHTGRAYRRAQALLDAVCSEAIVATRAALPPAAARDGIATLRRLLGPVQLGLAQLVLPPSGNDDASAPSAPALAMPPRLTTERLAS